MRKRISRFMTIGLGGFILQIATVAMLTLLARWPAAIATALGVEAAVLHNFFWHERWTWRDRVARPGARRTRLLRFHLTTGLTSIAGNVVITMVALRTLGLNAVAANLIAVLAMSVANFLVADRWVFAPTAAATAALVLFTRQRCGAPISVPRRSLRGTGTLRPPRRRFSPPRSTSHRRRSPKASKSVCRAAPFTSGAALCSWPASHSIS